MFIEAGAYDGVEHSNTLWLEANLNWKGLLVEANPDQYENIKNVHRKAWFLPGCLSIYPYPIKVSIA